MVCCLQNKGVRSSRCCLQFDTKLRTARGRAFEKRRGVHQTIELYFPELEFEADAGQVYLFDVMKVIVKGHPDRKTVRL